MMDDSTHNPERAEELGTETSRRTFVRVAVAGMGLAYAGAIGYPIFRYLNSNVEKEAELAAIKEVTLKDADKLPKGSILMFKFGPRPAMLIHHADDTWSAFEAVCTHMGCTVGYDAARERIACQCHGGQYDPKTGENVGGPPPRPLKKYHLAMSKGLATVTRI